MLDHRGHDRVAELVVSARRPCNEPEPAAEVHHPQFDPRVGQVVNSIATLLIATS